MIFKMAVRNIFANKLRSSLIVSLSSFCAALLVFYIGMTEGSHRKMMKDAIESYSGYIRIQYKGFSDNPDYDHLIYDTSEIIDKIKDIRGIRNYTTRFETYALLSSENNSFPAMFVAVEPEKEEYFSDIKHSVEGKFLNKDENYAVLGADLAKKLDVTEGGKPAYISTGLDYSIAADFIKIRGLFKTGFYDFDSGAVFVSKEYADNIFMSKNVSSYINILPEDIGKYKELQAKIQERLRNFKNIEVLNWREIQKELVKAVQIDSIFGYITIAIFFTVVFFVIMLFNMVAIMTRSREIGVLRAIGTSKSVVFKTLTAEGFIFGLLSIIIGGSAGAFITYYFQENPIQIGEYGEAYKELGFSFTEIPATLTPGLFMISVSFIFLLNILSVIIPAWQVNKLNPVEAIRKI